MPGTYDRLGHRSTAVPSTILLDLRWCVVRDNIETGVTVDRGAVVTVEASTIVATKQDSLGRAGRGLAVRSEAGDPETQLTLLDSVVADNHEAGVVLFGGELVVRGTSVSNTAPAGNGLYGDGILLAGFGEPNRATVADSCVFDNARAGWCRQQPICNNGGFCRASGGECVAGSDADCKAAAACKDSG